MKQANMQDFHRRALTALAQAVEARLNDLTSLGQKREMFVSPPPPG